MNDLPEDPNLPQTTPSTSPDLSSEKSLWRMADANFNRCFEGLRVLEDFFRFVKSDSSLTFQLKTLRHQLGQLVQKWPSEKRLTARDSIADVGRTIQTETEYKRESDESLIHSNFARVAQSLRVLEETAKRAGQDSKSLEQLRYQAYQLERQWQLSCLDSQIVRRKTLLEKARLYLLVDGHFSISPKTPDLPSPSSFADSLRQLAEAGADVIQLREKNLPDQIVFQLAKAAAEVLSKTDCLFIVNDRADMAVAADADGVHVGQEELPVEAARKVVGSSRLIGLSTHNLQQIKEASKTPVDYIGVGPVFRSVTKEFKATVGLSLLKEAINQIPAPAFAIGGIGLENLDNVLETGFGRIAVSGAVGRKENPLQATSNLKHRLTEK